MVKGESDQRQKLDRELTVVMMIIIIIIIIIQE